MAAEGENGEKTEDPTERRKGKARSDGNVSKSQDLSMVFGILFAYIGLVYVLPSMWRNLQYITIAGFTSTGYSQLHEPQTLESGFAMLLGSFLPAVLIVALLSGIAGGGSIAVQTKFLWSNKLLIPKFSNLNPIKGIKRLFGPQNMINLLKAIAKLLVICPIAYFSFLEMIPQLLDLMEYSVAQNLAFLAESVDFIFWRIMSALLVIALLDYVWQKYYHKRNMKMTKVEVKEERKSVEGDEKTKMMIRQKAIQKLRQAMLHDVPTADVVITNPTHFAVAIRYSPEKEGAPTVIAKGKNHMAQRIKSIARSHNVPLVERKPLARALFASVEVGGSVPYELYSAVAEILAWVYRVKGKTKAFMNKR